MKIAHFGTTGNAGWRIVAEALRRAQATRHGGGFGIRTGSVAVDWPAVRRNLPAGF